MALLARLKPHWQPLAGTALILTLGLLAALMHGLSSLQTQRQQLDAFGETLANSAAQRAVDATLSQDMISLQAALQELTRHQQVVGATVHDVENRLLAESGYPPEDAEPGEFRRYSATVALADNIAGHLELALVTPSLSRADRRFFLLWALAVLPAAALPWLPALRQAPVLRAPAPTGVDRETEPEPAETAPPPPARLRLRLTLTNLSRLQQQLNRDSFERQLRQFEHQLRNILSLYSGERLALSDDTLLIDFRGESDSDCAFRALCSAQLLGELSHLNPGPKLKLSARIHPLPETAALVPELHCQQRDTPTPGRGIEIAPELIDDELQQHLELKTDTGVLVGVKPPYRQLLDKQQAQLQTLTGSRHEPTP